MIGDTDRVVLTDKQKRFCQEYVIDLKQGEAYKRAGYKVKSDNAAWVCASKLLSNAKVKKYVSDLQEPIVKKSQSLAERAIEELKIHAFSDIGNLINSKGEFVSLKEISELPPEIRRTIESVEETKYGLKIRLVKKLPALELLGKHLGIFSGKIEQSFDRDAYYENMTTEELEALADKMEKIVYG